MEYIKINDSELEDLERKYFEMVEKHQVEPLKNSMKEDREKNTTKHEKKHKDMYRAIISEMMQFSGRKITEYGASQKISAISISTISDLFVFSTISFSNVLKSISLLNNCSNPFPKAFLVLV